MQYSNTAQYSAIQQYSNTAQYSIQHNTIPLSRSRVLDAPSLVARVLRFAHHSYESARGRMNSSASHAHYKLGNDGARTSGTRSAPSHKNSALS